MSHHHRWARFNSFLLLKVRPVLSRHRIESDGIPIRYTLGPEPPAAPMTGQIVVTEHFVVALGTSRLQAVASIGPEVRRPRARWSAVQPGIRVNYVHEVSIATGQM